MDIAKKTDLTCISEEGCIDNISDAYQLYGDCITSCDNAEGCLGLSEFENNWKHTCENIVMDHDQKMTRVRKKSLTSSNDKGFDTCPDCRKLRPNTRMRPLLPIQQPLNEEEEKEVSDE